EDLEFARRHALQPRIEPGLIARTGKLDGQFLLDIAMSGQAALHRFEQYLLPRALGYEAHGAGGQRLAHQWQLIVHAEEQNAQQRPALQQATSGFDTTDAGQTDLQDHQVRHPLLDGTERLFAITGFEDCRLRKLRREQAAVALPDNEVTIQ